MDPLVVTVDEAAHMLKISKAKVYELVASRELESAHFGRLRRIPVDALRRYLESNTESRDLEQNDETLDNAKSGVTVVPNQRSLGKAANGGISGSSAHRTSTPTKDREEARPAPRAGASRSRPRVVQERRDRRDPRKGSRS